MSRVLKQAAIPLGVWTEHALPSVEAARESLGRVIPAPPPAPAAAPVLPPQPPIVPPLVSPVYRAPVVEPSLV
jgi:hypothetical protein